MTQYTFGFNTAPWLPNKLSRIWKSQISDNEGQTDMTSWNYQS